MRLRSKPWVKDKINNFPFLYSLDNQPDETFAGHWREIIGVEKGAPLYVELGCGKGDFISQIAQREKNAAFVGIEVEQTVLYSAAVKVQNAEPPLGNVRLAVYDVKNLAVIFAPGEVTAFYINFCDPWPKARHAKRRLTNRRFLEIYRQILIPHGKIYFKTDNRPLFDYSLLEFEALNLNVSDVSFDLHATDCPENIETEFERKFSALGEKICRCIIQF